MKNNKKIIIVIAIIVLNVLVAYTIGQSLLGKASVYEDKLAKAREYAEHELCSKSITTYNEVLTITDTLDVRLEMIEVYRKGLEIGEFTNSYDVFTSITSAVDYYREEAQIYELACDVFLEYAEYENCAKLLMQARDFDVQSEKLTEYLNQVRYQYIENYAMYTDVEPFFDNAYTVQTDAGYIYLNNSVSQKIKSTFTYATSFSEGYAFVQVADADSKIKSFVINVSGERQIYLNDVETSSGVGKIKDNDGNELYVLACKVGNTYKYFDLNGNQVFEEYKFAGRFRNNIAAVQKSDGSWSIINGTGNPIIDKSFEDVILNEFDECSAKGFIFAKEDGKYNLYDISMNKVNNFSCDYAKSFVNGYAAFKSNDLWGFVDTEGNIVIQPSYIDAKSFSNSMGAIFNGANWSFININGEVVINDTYEDVSYLTDDGVCFVKKDGYWSYLKFYYTGE